MVLRAALMRQVERRKAGKHPVEGPALPGTPELVTYLEHRPQSEEGEQAPVPACYDVSATDPDRPYPGLTPAADADARSAIDETWGIL